MFTLIADRCVECLLARYSDQGHFDGREEKTTLLVFRILSLDATYAAVRHRLTNIREVHWHAAPSGSVAEDGINHHRTRNRGSQDVADVTPKLRQRKECPLRFQIFEGKFQGI